MKTIKAFICSIALFAMFAGTAAQAKTEIQWWHAFGGRLGELLDAQVNKFNASQDKYTVVHTRKGNYSETLNAVLKSMYEVSWLDAKDIEVFPFQRPAAIE